MQAETKIANTTKRPASRSPRAERSRKAAPSGSAVSASPALWTRSARSATLPERAKTTAWTAAVRPRRTRASATTRTPSRERLIEGSTRPCEWPCPWLCECSACSPCEWPGDLTERCEGSAPHQQASRLRWADGRARDGVESPSADRQHARREGGNTHDARRGGQRPIALGGGGAAGAMPRSVPVPLP